MKTKPSIFKITLLTIIIILSGCIDNQKDEVINPLDNIEEKSLKSSELSQTSSLTPEETDGLLFMREEEKLARDVYLELYSKYQHQVFYNISQSEQVHTDAILKLLNYYDLEDPFINVIGEFTEPTLQELYTILIDLGRINLDSALVVGAIIEETDLRDIEVWKSYTEIQNITQVYDHLISGSQNHLRAFVQDLDKRGIEYYPRILSIEKFNEIINN